MFKRLSDDDEAMAKVLEGITMFKGYKLSDAITPSDRAVALEAEDGILKQVVEWGEEWCVHTTADDAPQFKRECDRCWQALKQQVEKGK